MRRTFALTIGSIFERQLRYLLLSHAPELRDEIEKPSLRNLERLIGQVRGIALEDAGAEVAGAVRELWLVANAVRHGEGWSLRDLATVAPQLWGHLPTNAGHPQLIGDMRVKDSDLRRYTRAVTKFWRAAGASSVPML